MKKSLVAILLTFVLVFAAAAPVARAEGIMDVLRGLKEQIESAVSVKEEDGEKYNIERMVRQLLEYAKDQRGEAGFDFESIAEQIKGLLQQKEGGIDLSGLSSLIGMFTGGGDFDAWSLGGSTYFQEVEAVHNAIDSYVLDKYRDMIGPDDLPLIFKLFILNDENDTRQILGYCCLIVYTPDGRDLKQQFFADAVEYMAFDRIDGDEGILYTVAEAVPAEEGENRDAGIDALCERLGTERAHFDAHVSQVEIDWNLAYEMMDFLEEHPEFQRIEYEGEMKTYEELTAIGEALFDLSMEIFFADAETEAA